MQLIYYLLLLDKFKFILYFYLLQPNTRNFYDESRNDIIFFSSTFTYQYFYAFNHLHSLSKTSNSHSLKGKSYFTYSALDSPLLLLELHLLSRVAIISGRVVIIVLIPQTMYVSFSRSEIVTSRNVVTTSRITTTT